MTTLLETSQGGQIESFQYQAGVRFFNTAGEVVAANQQHYFTRHAPRQTGKTSVLAALANHLNATGRFRCAYTNVEDAQAARQDVSAAMRSILHSLGEEAAWTTGEELVGEIWPATFGQGRALFRAQERAGLVGGSR